MPPILRRFSTVPPLVADSALAVALFVLAEWQLWTNQRPAPLALLFVGFQTLPLVFRRRWPGAVFVLVAVIGAIGNLLAGYENSFFGTFGAMVAVYTVAAHGRRLLSWLVLGFAPLALALVLLIDWRNEGHVVLSDIPYNALLIAAAWVLGDNMRSRRAYIAQLEEREQLIGQQREERVQRTVMEERGRIARELHDVIAHTVSVMVLQATAGERIAEQNPDRAREALAAVQGTGRQALTELRRLLGLLRLETENSSERAPQPGISDISGLIEQVRRVGLSAELRVDTAMRPLPAGIELSAFRIVQEALTNTLRHAGATRADVSVRFSDRCLELEIRDNGVRAASASNGGGAGHGLIGMRERVQLFGGNLEAGPISDGGYRVLARMPVEPM